MPILTIRGFNATISSIATADNSISRLANSNPSNRVIPLPGGGVISLGSKSRLASRPAARRIALQSGARLGRVRAVILTKRPLPARTNSEYTAGRPNFAKRLRDFSIHNAVNKTPPPFVFQIYAVNSLLMFPKYNIYPYTGIIINDYMKGAVIIVNAVTLPKRTFHYKALIFFLALTLGAGFLGGLMGGISGFNNLVKPVLTPPAAVFPVVWTVLYILMGTAAYLVWNSNDIDGGRVLRLYLLQLLFNMLWPLFFFRLNWRLFSFFWLLILLALVSLVITGFKYIKKSAYLLMLPYFIWLVFAAYLNFGFYLLNKK